MVLDIENWLWRVIWVPGMIKPSGSVIFWKDEAVKVIEAMEVVEALEVIETAEVLGPGKSLQRTSVIQVLEFSFILIFWKKTFFGGIWKYHVEF